MYIQYHNNPKLISSIDSRIYYPIINLFMIMTMIKTLRIRMKFGSKICKIVLQEVARPYSVSLRFIRLDVNKNYYLKITS